MSSNTKINRLKQLRQKRVRASVRGTAERPRLTVFRSNKHMYAQVIDDNERKTLTAVSSHELKQKMTKAEAAQELGTMLAKKALAKKLKKMAFDRSYYRYHGRVQQFANAARKAGLEF